MRVLYGFSLLIEMLSKFSFDQDASQILSFRMLAQILFRSGCYIERNNFECLDDIEGFTAKRRVLLWNRRRLASPGLI